MAQDMRARVASLGLKQVSLVGHDIGLMVAYAYAAQHRDEVRRIALMDAFLPGVFLIAPSRLVARSVEGVEIPGSGHWLMEEAPGQGIPRLVEFLDRWGQPTA